MSGPRPGTASPPADVFAGWRDDAARVGSGHLFFGPEEEAILDRRRREREAKRICARCTVKAPCLEYAESLPADYRYHGVFGGFGEEDRESLRRRRSQLARLQREEAAS